MKTFFNIFFIIFYFFITVFSNIGLADCHANEFPQKFYISTSTPELTSSFTDSEFYYVNENNENCELYQGNSKNDKFQITHFEKSELLNKEAFYIFRAKNIFLTLSDNTSPCLKYQLSIRAP